MNHLYLISLLFSREDFFRSIKTRSLYEGAICFTIISIGLVIAIYIHLFIKKRKFFRNEAITETLNETITEVLLSEGELILENIARPQLLNYLKNRSNRQFVINSLINIQKNVSGDASQKIPELYEILGLKDDSLKKFNSAAWYDKSKGIYELYMMNQKDLVHKIFRYTNDKNEFLRMEAQTASISFLGFEGLEFLNDLTQPLHQWQQLKILEQLKYIDTESFEHMGLWLNSSNEFVVLFALKLAEIYQQFQYRDQVAKCLSSNNEKIRKQAILALGKIDIGDCGQILKENYNKESDKNKEVILRQFSHIGVEDDAPFLIKKLYETKDSLKLEAARALVKCSPDGYEIVRTLSDYDTILHSILKQIKYETAR